MMDTINVGSISAAANSVYAGSTRAVQNGGASAAVHVAVPVSANTSEVAAATAVTISDAELEKAMERPIAQANKALGAFDRRIDREIHEVTKAVMYIIRDTETNEVIAEYPPKKIQDMIAKMWELAGLFVDQKA